MTTTLPLPRRPLVEVTDTRPRTEYRTVHGYRRAFVRAGQGPALLFLHGLGDSADTWYDLISVLARDHTVIAPDMLGHGRSDKPRGDYSVSAYATGLRDLLAVLEIDRATVVGHSLGGGVAMQFAYQYPQNVERLVLVSTGGVGAKVSPALRLGCLPAADALLQAMRLSSLGLASLRGSARLSASALRWLPGDLGHDLGHMLHVLNSLPDTAACSAAVRTLRSVVDWRGQVVSMLDRCYLAQGIPTLIVWGRHDTILPVEHADVIHGAIPGSRLELFEDSGHYPHHCEPAKFLSVLQDFIATTLPAAHDPEQWRAMLRGGRPDAAAALTAAVDMALTTPQATAMASAMAGALGVTSPGVENSDEFGPEEFRPEEFRPEEFMPLDELAGQLAEG